MKLSSIILKIAYPMDGQRSLNACLHILRGKRSGQTLQDADTFSLKPYFSILPKLSDAAFAESADHLLSAGLLAEHGGLMELSPAGKAAACGLPDYRFDGWHYRGRETLFFQRLQLLVQTYSELRSRQHAFLPVTNDRTVQQFVKQVMRSRCETAEAAAAKLAEELLAAIRKSGMQDMQAAVFTHRLTGAGVTGWTWEQLEEAADEPRNRLQLSWLEGLHRLIAAAEKPEAREACPILHKLTEGIRVDIPLTDSASVTNKLFAQGHTLEEIARMRKLKASTIEDHFTEIAANIAGFPISRFVSEEDQSAVRQEVAGNGVKRLRLLKDKFPHLTYFQLRLVLGTMKGGLAE